MYICVMLSGCEYCTCLWLIKIIGSQVLKASAPKCVSIPSYQIYSQSTLNRHLHEYLVNSPSTSWSNWSTVDLFSETRHWVAISRYDSVDTITANYQPTDDGVYMYIEM